MRQLEKHSVKTGCFFFSYNSEAGRSEKTRIVVPEGCFYVVGDNQEVSDDSMSWKDPFVAISRVIAII